MAMTERGYQNIDRKEQRFGFNTQERDDDIDEGGNHYTAEFWEYDSRTGRRWNIDPVVKEYESPYACLGNNPIWFNDMYGADTLKASTLNQAVEKYKSLGKLVEEYGSVLKQQREKLEKMEEGIDTHNAVVVAAAASFNPFAKFAALVAEINYQFRGVDEAFAKNEENLKNLEAVFGILYAEFTAQEDFIAGLLKNADALETENGAILAAATPVIATHKNSNSAKGNFALYEIKIDGETYKFGVADADDLRSNGKIERIAKQEKWAERRYPKLTVETSYKVYQNVTKLDIKGLEDIEVEKYLKKTGYIPDGNTGHLPKHPGSKTKGRFPAKLK